jgi:hypothetical protein
MMFARVEPDATEKSVYRLDGDFFAIRPGPPVREMDELGQAKLEA